MKNPQELHKEFLQLGMMKNKLTNRMLLILPEIYKSGIYKKYAATIIEYAGKFGGISRSAVEKRLRLEKHLEDKPALKAAIAEVGIHKVSMLATIATAKTDEVFADKAKNMSKAAIEVLSKELRQREFPTDVEPCQAKAEKITIELDEEMSFQFLKLKQKFGKNLGNKEIMKKILEEAGGKNESTKNSGKPEQPTDKKTVTGDGIDKVTPITTQTTRYMTVAKRRETTAKTDGKCTYPGCNKPSEIFHHTDRFANSRNHQSLTCLCKVHHEFMHNGLIENESDPAYWTLNINKSPDQIDELYRKYRQGIHG